jgi:hypothetical protein
MTEEAELRGYLAREILPPGESVGFGDDDNLFERVDSMQTIRLVAHIEKEYGIEVDDQEMIPENLGSIRLLADLIRRKMTVHCRLATPPETAAVEPASSTRRLNVADRVAFHAHEVLRQFGYAGFLNQTYIELAGRVDAEKLRSAVVALGSRYPETKSRLVIEADGPHWSTTSGACCAFRTVQLTSDNEAESLGVAEELLSTPLDLGHAPPLQFHLLRRPGGRDVLLLHRAHALTDISATPLILDQLNRFGAGEMAGDGFRQGEEQDGVRAHLKHFPLSRRVRAALYRLYDQAPLDGKTLMPVGPGSQHRGGKTGIVIRRFTPAEAVAFRSALQRISSLISSSIGLLASVFRVLDQQCPSDGSSRRLNATLGVNLRTQMGQAPVFQNIASAVRVSVGRKSHTNRDALVQELNNQLRARTVRGYDLGTLQLMTLLLPKPLFLRRRLAKLMLENSVIYGYVKWRSNDATELCGTPVTNLFQASSAWAPPGLAITANEGFGTLCLMATYIESALSRERVQEFLDAVVEDAAA